MNIAVLFDGAGLARLGLEQAGHNCTGFELDPIKHHFSVLTGRGNCVLADATEISLDGFDAVWASPPCQQFSRARTQGAAQSAYANDYLSWSLAIKTEILWVENVSNSGKNGWGTLYNAGQFIQAQGQNRVRVIGGRYKEPKVFWPYQRKYKTDIPTILATEYKGSAKDPRRASRHFGRRLTLEECAKYQGLPQEILTKYLDMPNWWPDSFREWKEQVYEAIGNGVPVYMAKAFGEAYAHVPSSSS